VIPIDDSKGATPAEVKVEDRGDGTYLVTYRADSPGQYEIDSTIVETSINTTTPQKTTSIAPSTSTSTTATTTTTFRTTTAISVTYAATVFIDNRITAAPPPTQPKVDSTTKPPSNALPNDVENLLTAGDSAHNLDHANTSNLLVIIIPAVLCGIWLILIIVLLVVCLRRRKQRQREKYGLGYYLPPTSTSGAQSTVGPINTNGSAASGYSYGSQWTIPRPTFDYYNGTYYPDPYSSYKY